MFFILRIRISPNGTTTKSVYEHDNYVSAIKQYFQTLAADVDAENIKSNLCMLISETGNVCQQRYFDHSVQQVVSEDE